MVWLVSVLFFFFQAEDGIRDKLVTGVVCSSDLASCHVCGGSGCRVCKFSGWIELFGAGMVDPAVYGFVNYDAKQLSGFAFGMGVERFAMRKYGISDIQLFFQNDVRFLRQFP